MKKCDDAAGRQILCIGSGDPAAVCQFASPRIKDGAINQRRIREPCVIKQFQEPVDGRSVFRAAKGTGLLIMTVACDLSGGFFLLVPGDCFFIGLCRIFGPCKERDHRRRIVLREDLIGVLSLFLERGELEL